MPPRTASDVCLHSKGQNSRPLSQPGLLWGNGATPGQYPIQRSPQREVYREVILFRITPWRALGRRNPAWSIFQGIEGATAQQLKMVGAEGYYIVVSRSTLRKLQHSTGWHNNVFNENNENCSRWLVRFKSPGQGVKRPQGIGSSPRRRVRILVVAKPPLTCWDPPCPWGRVEIESIKLIISSIVNAIYPIIISIMNQSWLKALKKLFWLLWSNLGSTERLLGVFCGV